MKVTEVDKVVDTYIGEGGNPANVLRAVVEAMMETASHLESNWQDHGAARHWERLARRVQKLEQTIDKELHGGSR